MRPTSAEPPVKRGFCAPCPRCLEEGIHLSLADLDEVYCTSCEETMSLGQIRTLVEGWAAVLQWVDSAPVLED